MTSLRLIATHNVVLIYSSGIRTDFIISICPKTIHSEAIGEVASHICLHGLVTNTLTKSTNKKTRDFSIEVTIPKPRGRGFRAKETRPLPSLLR